jgi:dsRNA-specific ribonuclease
MAQASAPKKMAKRYIDLERGLPPVQVQQGSEAFRVWIIELLEKRSKLKRSEAERYTDASGMARFEMAMTHSSVNPFEPDRNYEILEHLGDATVNKATTWYLKNRFPEIVRWGNRGVQYLSKQKSLLTSKAYLAEFAKALGIVRFIHFRPLQFTYAKAGREAGGGTVVTQTVTMDRSMEEDAFEAFFAALEEVVDDKDGVGVGYFVAYSVLASFYDERDIPTSLNDLVDAKTQLKEVFDKRNARYGDSVRWDTDEKNKELWVRIHFEQPPGKEPGPFNLNIGPYSLVAKGADDGDFLTSKAIIEQQASRDALAYLQKAYPAGNQFVRYTSGE